MIAHRYSYGSLNKLEITPPTYFHHIRDGTGFSIDGPFRGFRKAVAKTHSFAVTGLGKVPTLIPKPTGILHP